jgi:glycosyltransferase involved in cell wall biosynthesis
MTAPRPDGELDLSVVVPVLDERDAIGPLLEEVAAACEALDGTWEVIVVDDGSTDGTCERLAALREVHPALRVLRLRRNFGKSAALQAGFAASAGRRVVTLDGDGQDDPAEIPRLLAELDRGFDVVSGWKRQREDPVVKRWPSRVFNALTARVSGVPLHDVNCGLKAYRGDEVRGLELYGEQHRLIPVLGAQRGWRIGELPVNHRPREHGRSKFGMERYARGFLDLIGVLFMGRYQHRPLHLFGGLGLLALAAGVLVCAYLSVEWLTGEAIGRRPLLLLGILLILTGMQLFTLGLVGEMITAMRQELRGSRGDRPAVAEELPAGDPAGAR